LVRFPEYKNLYSTWRDKWENLISATEGEYEEVMEKVGDDQQQSKFAQHIKNHRFKNAFFAMRSGKTAREYYASCPVKLLLNTLKT